MPKLIPMLFNADSGVNTNTGNEKEQVMINVSDNHDLEDLRLELSDNKIVALLVVLIQLARQGNNDVKYSIAAFNRLLDDQVPCLPTRDEWKKFHLHEHKLMDLMSILSAEAELNTKNRIVDQVDKAIATLMTTPVDSISETGPSRKWTML